ncbi:uncharacterized protein LOC123566035 isoform X2 [Mercenaria mercenaria]|uniref:uncharacterized protein LOC123566035 isoform X2 n=1 Tax=Mercenaria mercenaria TaxID=6596 RepID=UPI00234EE148|nr:uncharacterized protein LOC123566035 isoform X2 [Mercenaria mercenaria]
MMIISLLIYWPSESGKDSNYYTFLHYENESNINNQEKQYDLRVIVIVYDRAHSLHRLLRSLNDAEYFSDLIKVEVWIDRSENGNINEAILNTARDYVFKHGVYDVNLYPYHVGIYGQRFTSYKPNLNSSEIAVILEDDLTVSKYFWKCLKLVHQTYDNYTYINGYALQGITTTFGVKNTHTLQGPTSDYAFLFPVISTWGFSPNKKKWKIFFDWYIFGDARSTMPYIPGHLATVWFKGLSKKGRSNTMWEIWHIYYASKHKEYTLYYHTGLTTNWMEKGLHYTTSLGASSPLLTVWKKEYESFPKKPIYVDISGKVIETRKSS